MKHSLCIAILTCLILGLSCTETRPERQEASPRTTVRELLEAHGLWQKLPEERDQTEIDRAVPRETLRRYFADLDRFDPFTGDLYMGFIVGALARSQERLHIQTEGRRGTVHAGYVKVALIHGTERWQIVIDDTIPEEIRQRALEEQRKLGGSAAAAQELNRVIE